MREDGRYSDEVWQLTGKGAWLRGWFGRAVLMIEERRRVWRPVVMGHSPANWILAKRWRKARFADVGRLEV